ncbi:NADP-dependent oxidoreductase [Pseudomonas sp. p1(2021b)]|uniref:quinone oxidoreductase family protein n=1 Tax=Pseudomonas sp. p1(2021b) TaxID=2874628 RepID=UPI001CCD49EC|nr:NADP-dependent oxidoreductase [Pseudomonas sp. p1(2021b)]UBM23635.1 NADP-dependent oxidoreductase [Pseudomonas sp. p1(2021b)]
MRAVVIDQLGSSQVLRLATLEQPLPGPGEVLVRVHCAGVNPADWKCREGYLGGFLTYRFPFVLGFDLAGTVAAVGEGVTGFTPGMRVFAQSDVGAGNWGSYAEYCCVRQDSVVPIPEGLGFAQAASVPTPALAAWAGLFDDGGLQAGQKVLVHGGAGAVGTFAIQLAKAAGAHVVATCSGQNLDYVESLGCDQAIDYRTQDILAVVKQWSPAGVDLILDCVGCASLPGALDMLCPGGLLVAILTLAAGDAGPDHGAAAQRGLRTAVTYSKMPSGANLARIAALLTTGQVRTPRIQTLALEQVAHAHDLLQDGGAKAKLVLRVVDGD